MAIFARMLKATPEELGQLQRWIKGHNTPRSVLLRAQIIVESLRTTTNKEIGVRVGVSQPTIRRWQRRFAQGGVYALSEIAPGRGRKPTYDSRKVGQIICATQNEKPAAATHWSCRAMAKRQGVSKATIARIQPFGVFVELEPGIDGLIHTADLSF